VGKVNESMSTTTSAVKRTPRQRLVRRLSVVGLLLTLVFFFGVLLSPVLDSIDVQTVRCEVESAAPRTASGGSRGSASTPEVRIETSDCGPLSIESGLTFDNSDELASTFEVGAEYDFEIGWFSRVIMTNVFHGSQTVQGYQLVE
jgi:hypothetical protein